MRNDVLLHICANRLGAEFLHGAFDCGLDGLNREAGGIAELDMNHNTALVVGFNALQHAGRDVVRTDHGVDQF